MKTRTLIQLALIGLGLLIGLRPAYSDELPESPPVSQPDADSRADLALLVGCTQYPDSKMEPLFGPVNDVALFQTMLEKLGISASRIQRLVGWPDDVKARPTQKNISRAFEKLIADTTPNASVVILLAGHGTRFPVIDQANLLDPRNPEPDGLDEVFLPADYKDGTEVGIRDNQIGTWLDRLRDKGANVWIIFDCCHSGTMTRSGNSGEFVRGVSPQSLGVSPTALKRSRQESAALRSQLSLAPVIAEDETLEVTSGSERGSLVATYAAQPYEETPEVPRPSLDAVISPENAHGLLSYQLCTTLSRLKKCTYRSLYRQLIREYRAERGAVAPTPFFVGDLDTFVLGRSRKVSPSPLRISHGPDGLTVSAGSLYGLTPGTILGVESKDGAPELSAYVEIVYATLYSSTVQSVSYGDLKHPVPEAKITADLACRVVRKSIGDMEVRVAFVESLSSEATIANAVAHDAMKSLPAEIRSMISPESPNGRRGWRLQVTTPKEAAEHYDVQVDEHSLLLIGDVEYPTAKVLPDVPRDDASPTRPRVYSRYALADAKQTAGKIASDIQKIFTWENMWKIANESGQEEFASSGFSFQISEVGAKSGVVWDKPYVTPGQRLQVVIKNESPDRFWVVVFSLSADFSIKEWVNTSLGSWDELRPLRYRITDSSSGVEGFVAFAIPITQAGEKPNFTYLQQPGLGGRQDLKRSAASIPHTAFGRLLHTAAFGKISRGQSFEVEDAPVVRSWSYITLPATDAPQSQTQ